MRRLSFFGSDSGFGFVVLGIGMGIGMMGVGMQWGDCAAGHITSKDGERSSCSSVVTTDGSHYCSCPNTAVHDFDFESEFVDGNSRA